MTESNQHRCSMHLWNFVGMYILSDTRVCVYECQWCKERRKTEDANVFERFGAVGKGWRD